MSTQPKANWSQLAPIQQPAAPSAPPQAPTLDQEYALYLAVVSGQRSPQSLTPQELREYQIIAAMVQRPRYTSQKCEDLADKQDAARDAAEQLRLCLAGGGDDCSFEMDNAQDAQQDYQDALDDTDGDCQ